MAVTKNPNQNSSRGTITAFCIIALSLGAIIGWGLNAFSKPSIQPVVVTPNIRVIEQLKLPENNPGELTVLTDHSTFDLRPWKPVPKEIVLTDAISPVNYTNYLRIKKNKDVKLLFAHYATSGLRIDMQCPTHNFTVLRKEFDNLDSKRNYKEYAVAVDISKEPIGKVFQLVIQATYWNGFRSETEGDASTYTDGTTTLPENLSILILFPENKPLKSLILDTSPNNAEKWSAYKNSGDAIQGKNGQYAYWNVRTKQINHHYRMQWRW